MTLSCVSIGCCFELPLCSDQGQWSWKCHLGAVNKWTLEPCSVWIVYLFISWPIALQLSWRQKLWEWERAEAWRYRIYEPSNTSKEFLEPLLENYKRIIMLTSNCETWPWVIGMFFKICHCSPRFPACYLAHTLLVTSARHSVRLQGQLFLLRGLWWAKPSHTARAKGFWVVESSFSVTATFKDQEVIQNTGTWDQRPRELLLISRWEPCKCSTNYCLALSH